MTPKICHPFSEFDPICFVQAVCSLPIEPRHRYLYLGLTLHHPHHEWSFRVPHIYEVLSQKFGYAPSTTRSTFEFLIEKGYLHDRGTKQDNDGATWLHLAWGAPNELITAIARYSAIDEVPVGWSR